MTEGNALDALVTILKKKPDFYFAKFIDTFIDDVPHALRGELLLYIADQVGSDKWDRLARDEYEHLALIRSILWHYSGREEKKGEPSTTDLASLIEDFTKTPAFHEAMVEPTKSKKSFGSLMEDL